MVPEAGDPHAKLTKPRLLLAGSPEEVRKESNRALGEARRTLEAILAARETSNLTNTLVPFNDLLLKVADVSGQGEILSSVHPEEAFRTVGDEVHQEAQRFLTELFLNRPLYQAFAALDVEVEDYETRYAVLKILRDFRRAGVDREEEVRAKIKELQDEIVAVCQEFDRNIREDVRAIRVDSSAELEGLPEDFIDSHLPDENGIVTVTTDYLDLIPVLKYADGASVRRRLHREHLNRGYPLNMEVLDRLLAKRRELAEILGYASWADYVTEDKMIESAQAAEEFIDRITELAGPRSEEDYRALLDEKRKDDPEATHIQAWDRLYYAERVRDAQHNFDSKEVRAYFSFEMVLEGLLTITSRLFGVRYEPVRGPTYHESVRLYDVFQGEVRLGRIYLDLHPRKAKFTHAAAPTVVSGVRDIQLPQGLLMCNFPDPDKVEGPALMDHIEVVTFFHEFGHLIHGIFAGNGRWAYNTPDYLEWDFNEAPSQLLEEWAWDVEALQSFAIHHETGEPIPRELVDRMGGADALGRGLSARRGVFLAALSLNYHTRDPRGMNTTAVARELQGRYDLVPWFEGTHLQCSFLHLNGLSALYYTYDWSLVIAKDIFTRFQAQRSLLDPTEAERYRTLILAPGSARPAAELVEAFLERPRSFEAYEAWIKEVPGQAGSQGAPAEGR